MNKHLCYQILRREEISKKKSKVKNLMDLITEKTEVNEKIMKNFSVDYFGNQNRDIEVMGSYDLINRFKKVEGEKIDLIKKIEDVEYIGVGDNKQIILDFKDDDIKGRGEYSFTYDFFEELFSMGKYAKFCIDNDLNDLLKKNLKDLISKFGEKEKQFRLLKIKDEIYIRAITSTKYNNYDNNLAIYFSLILLDNFAIKQKVDISITEMHLSDSGLRIIFEQCKPLNIEGLGDVYLGFVVTNGEIRDSQFSFEIRYRIVDKTNKEIEFCIMPDLKDSIFSINHLTGIDKVIAKMDKTNDINNLKETMLDYLKKIKNSSTLSSDYIYSLMNKITKSRKIDKKTKDKFKELYDQNIIDNAVTLIEKFNQINKIVTNIDERIYFERIYYQVISDIVN